MKKFGLLLFVLSLCTFSLKAQNQKNVSLDQVSHDFRFSAGGGLAFRLGERPAREYNPQLDRMSKDLERGFNVDMDAQYFFKDLWGLGINANYVQTSTSGTDIEIDGISINKYKEVQKFFFIGPTANVRGDLKKFIFITTFGVGPLMYTSNIHLNNQLIKGTQTAFAIYAGISGEYKINRSLGAGFKLSYTRGSINSLNLGNGNKINYASPISVSNLMISAFLSFRTWK